MSRAKAIVKRGTPIFAQRAYRSMWGRWDRNDLLLNADAMPGPMVDIFNSIRDVPGYFTYDDCVAFTLALGIQTAAGLHGDIFEIGSYRGRSTAVLAKQLRPGERLFVCDTFENPDPATGGYPDKPSPSRLMAHLRDAVPELTDDQIEIIEGYSTAIAFAPGQRFRFIHIDGGHQYDVARSDLDLAVRHLLTGGLIVLDDYHHPWYPDVTVLRTNSWPNGRTCGLSLMLTGTVTLAGSCTCA